jgi:hypothetical protein
MFSRSIIGQRTSLFCRALSKFSRSIIGQRTSLFFQHYEEPYKDDASAEAGCQ